MNALLFSIHAAVQGSQPATQISPGVTFVLVSQSHEDGQSQHNRDDHPPMDFVDFDVHGEYASHQAVILTHIHTHGISIGSCPLLLVSFAQNALTARRISMCSL